MDLSYQRKGRHIICWIVCCLHLSGPAWATAPVTVPEKSLDAQTPELTCVTSPDEPKQAVKNVFSSLTGVYTAALPGPAGVAMMERKANTLAQKHVDVETFSAEVLRGAWQKADEDTKKRWSGALSGLLHKRYLAGFRDPRRHTLVVGKATIDCPRAEVEGVLNHRRLGEKTAFTIYLRKKDDVWRAWDVAVEKTSLVKTWRSRLLRFYRDGGSRELDRQLRRLAKRLGADP